MTQMTRLPGGGGREIAQGPTAVPFLRKRSLQVGVGGLACREGSHLV